MKELVGTCSKCGKHVYCREGFLDGIVTEKKKLYCWMCVEGASEKENSE